MEATTAWRSRIVGHGEAAPDQLLANPYNFRRHPARQRDALRGSLDELSIITPVVVNQTTGHLIDGHARVEEYLSAGVPLVPVVYVELTEEEEKLALALLDPIASLAASDHRALNELLADLDTEHAGLADLLADLQRQAESYYPDLDPTIGTREVTDEDVRVAADRLADRGGQPEQSRVLCPHCGGSFFV